MLGIGLNTNPRLPCKSVRQYEHKVEGWLSEPSWCNAYFAI